MPSTGEAHSLPWNGLPLLSGVIALLLFVPLVLTLLCLMLPGHPENVDVSADGARHEQENAVAQWQALWAAIEQRGEAALQPENLDPALRSAGDTIFMRYRNLWRDVDATTQHTFQMAALANTPADKLRLLQPLATASVAQVRLRALLEIARVHLRLRALTEARAVAQQALTIPDLAPKMVADFYFILGCVALEAHDFDAAEMALAQAVARDPGFWDARQTQLLVLSHQLSQPRPRVAACLNRTRLMIENLGALPTLAQDRTQFRDIADRFADQPASVNPAFSLLSGLGYLWAGDRDKARAAWREVRRGSGKLPRQCEALIVAKAEELARP